MKKGLLSLLILSTLLTACNAQETVEQKNVVKKEEKAEVNKKVQPDMKDENTNEEERIINITLDDFKKKYKQDPEEKQYKDGKFKLEDGSIILADDFSYGESDIFDYATAIFFQGKLAHLQLETDKSPEEIEKALGIRFNSGNTVEQNSIGFEINFDKNFLDSNISVFPSEW